MDTTKLFILAVDSNRSWLSNTQLFRINKTYDIQISINGKEALELFATYNPKIVLIGKTLSDMSGITFLNKLVSLKNIKLPIIIFIDSAASYTQIRVVMDLGADDFLFDNSINNILKAIATQLHKREKIVHDYKHSNTMLTELPEVFINKKNENTNAKYNDYLFLDDKDTPGFYAIKDFIYISSLRDYTQIHTAHNKIITLHKTLTFWQNFLPKNKFLRIHRQTIINLDHVEKVEPSNSYRYKIYLGNVRNPLIISQRYSQKIKNSWGIKTIE